MAHGDSTHHELVLDGLGRRFGDHWAVRDVSVRIDGPQGVALTGDNGSGKTTLLRMLAQLLRPSEGTFSLNGTPLTSGHDSAAVRAQVGYVAHTPTGAPEMSVHDNLMLAGRLHSLPPSQAAGRAEASAETWALHDVASSTLGSLSRGWAQRYALARATIMSPAVLLLDEPTLALDSAGRELLQARVRELCESAIVIAASHEHEWLAEWTSAAVAL